MDALPYYWIRNDLEITKCFLMCIRTCVSTNLSQYFPNHRLSHASRNCVDKIFPKISKLPNVSSCSSQNSRHESFTDFQMQMVSSCASKLQREHRSFTRFPNYQMFPHVHQNLYEHESFTRFPNHQMFPHVHQNLYEHESS
ncbi:hypothetical protein AVEN_258625-1 [Araneus ventricosus]|uniref:Uncharacterized protein n=1 Tax=Araneus ventricosus TaxID=182803 RepID=A0A4Y2HMN8_ARAVE|nr:hypothetical protein AVEN_258625-1 [Araneus ventricosus]